MNSKNRKAKGRRLQNWVASKLRIHFPDLDADDIRPAIMGQSGEDIILSPAARRIVPFSIECKNSERFAVWSALSQAEQNAPAGTVPMVVFKRNRSKAYVAMEFEEFLKMIGDGDE